MSARAQCQLNSPSGEIKHVVYVEFDNVHFTRDNPNVPSDLEHLPNLLNFIKQNGTLDAGNHTVLISHTANDILTAQTGLLLRPWRRLRGQQLRRIWPRQQPIEGFLSFFVLLLDRPGVGYQPETNDNSPALTTPEGKNVAAPWVPFTRAGCDVGAFSTANIVLERAPFDVQKAFGAGSDQAKDANAFDDSIGASIHCALGSQLCSAKNGGVADLLPDEPGGYSGY
jgi:hypothetical protein